jgi:hypothetical protein
MPDPLLILQSMVVAACVSAAALAVVALPRRPASPSRAGIGWSLAIGVGFLAGCWVFGRAPRWPPKVDLDRLLTIVLPLVVVVEGGLAYSRAPARINWLIRWLVVLASARILLHNSVYLVGPESSRWTALETWLLLAGVAAGATVVWFGLQWYSERNKGATGPLILALTAVAVGVTTMLSGYATGGQLAMPLAAAIAGATGIAWAIGAPSSGAIGVGYLLTCCLIFVGLHFAELSAFHATVLVTAPLWCLLTEIPLVKSRRPWIKKILAAVLVAIPLAVVLIQLQRQFVERSKSATDAEPSQPSISDYY